MVKGKQRAARKKRLAKQEEEAKRLYICTYEYSGMGKIGYRVQYIRLSDLYQFPDTPIPMLSSKLLHQVDFLHGPNLPDQMSFGVFGSRILLAGGQFWHSWKTTDGEVPPSAYVLDTKEADPKFISSSTNADSSWVIPELEVESSSPWLGEINGKLYTLSGLCSGDPAFHVLSANPQDPNDEPEWYPLPRPSIMPFRDEVGQVHQSSTCAVLGTKIFVTNPSKIKMFCFDVAHPERPWTTHRPIYYGDRDDFAFPGGPFKPVLIFDSNKDEEKLMFCYHICDFEIQVSNLTLPSEGKPGCINPVSTIELPAAIDASSYSCAHLGGRKVCFLLMNGLYIQVFTFEFSCSPFSVKHLGRLLIDFEFKSGSGKEYTWGTQLLGCCVLNSMAPSMSAQK